MVVCGGACWPDYAQVRLGLRRSLLGERVADVLKGRSDRLEGLYRLKLQM